MNTVDTGLSCREPYISSAGVRCRFVTMPQRPNSEGRTEVGAGKLAIMVQAGVLRSAAVPDLLANHQKIRCSQHWWAHQGFNSL
jgi:hypothetical protein